MLAQLVSETLAPDEGHLGAGRREPATDVAADVPGPDDIDHEVNVAAASLVFSERPGLGDEPDRYL